MFISRKDSKLYVRQNFKPVFEVPVTIAPSDRPLGTHVFTAEVDKNDSQRAALVGGLAAGRRGPQCATATMPRRVAAARAAARRSGRGKAGAGAE